MTTQTMGGRQRYAMFALLAALAASGEAFAQERGHGAFGKHEIRVHEHFDARFSHNHSYFDRGYIVPELPHSGYAIDRDREHYWYDRGQWYRREGLDWIVVDAPVGVFVSVLPPFYTTLWAGGVAYYYANDTYYSQRGEKQYVVVAPPVGIN